MATVVKNFRIKSGLIVEGTTATLNGVNFLAENTAGNNYILNLVGGATLVKSVDSGVFGVNGAGKLTINANTFDSYGSASAAQAAAATDATNKANAAQSAAASDATSKANAAQSAASSDATSKANAARSAAEATASSDATSKANAARSAAEATASADATSKANAAKAAAEATASADATSKANAAQAAAESYTDAEVSALVGSAPELLDTLNELAAAIANNPNYATDVANLVADKADTSYVNSQIGSLGSAAQGYALDAQSAAETFATNAIDALTTSDIEEGSNLYFTDSRVKNLTGDFLENSTQSNIAISYDPITQQLTVTAENGVADSDTDDLTEGTTNLYFTDSRAVNALEAVVPNFTAVELNSVAKQIAATVSAPTIGEYDAFGWNKTEYRSAEFLVKVAYGNHTQISKVLLTLDTSDNIAITEYGVVGTNGSTASVSADVFGVGIVRLLVTTSAANSTVTVVGTLLV